MRYRCWNANNWEEGEQPPVEDMWESKWRCDATDDHDDDVETPAADFMEKTYSDDDYPEEMDVRVYNPCTGKVKAVTVYAEPSVSFRAVVVKP